MEQFIKLARRKVAEYIWILEVQLSTFGRLKIFRKKAVETESQGALFRRDRWKL